MWLLEEAPDPLPYGVEELLREYPFKQFQIWFQGSNPESLVEFHRNRLAKQASNGDLFVLTQGDLIGACFNVDQSQWHSEIFGKSFYRINDLLTRRNESGVTAEAINAALDVATEEGAEVITTRIDSSDFDTANCLAGTGFQSVGHTVKLSLHLENYDLTPYEGRIAKLQGFTGGDVRESDIESLSELAALTHTHSHFFNDPRMEEKARKNLFPEWVAKCARGHAQRTIVLRSPEQIAGFVTCIISRSLQQATGHIFGIIDFVAVAPVFQGQGLGKTLVAEALRYLKSQGCTMAEVRTMNDNYRAIALYQGFGFTLTSSDQVFHLWF